MKQATGKQKMVRPVTPVVEQEMAAGAHGVALAPPRYGVDLVDRHPIQALAEQEHPSLESATWPIWAGALQRQAASPHMGTGAFRAHRENRTGLPDALKAGVEHLSGITMDDVRVHYNSPKPAPLQALAYTQGTEIHVAPRQERHLPHEAWHVVQQKQGRVKPTTQLKGKVNINDDAVLESEADQMGQKALNQSFSKFQSQQVFQKHSPEITRPVIQAVYVPDYPDEDFLIARIRGIDTVLGIYNGAASDIILDELDKLTDQISSKIWLRAVAVMLALREKWQIHQFPPPLIPFDSPPLVDGNALLKAANVKFLPSKLKEEIKSQPGTKRIELGAGPMDSASHFWMQEEHTAFTEFRSEEELRSDYGEGFTHNLKNIQELDPKNIRGNKIEYGIDATQEGAFKSLPLTENLRFTNPNIGHDDIKDEIATMIMDAVKTKQEDPIVYRSMGMIFLLDLSRIGWYQEISKKSNWLETIITSTVNSISTCRNINLMHRFMLNAPGKLISGAGRVEIIVSTSYLKRWPLIEMAQDMGYEYQITNNYELGFKNIKTQESKGVSEKEPEKTMITLTLPWGGVMKTSHVIAYCNTLTEWTERQPTLLAKVWTV